MERFVNDTLNSLMLYGVIAFVAFWSMMACVWFDVLLGAVPFLVYTMGSLPVMISMDFVMYLWRNSRT